MSSKTVYHKGMLLPDITDRLSTILEIRQFDAVDVALNGLQVSRAEQEVRQVAFAVDASMASFERAAAAQADLLFVHHGLFWGKPASITGVLFRRSSPPTFRWTLTLSWATTRRWPDGWA